MATIDFESMALKCPDCQANKAHIMKVQRYMTDDWLASAHKRRVLFRANAIVCAACKSIRYFRAGQTASVTRVLGKNRSVRIDYTLKEPDNQYYVEVHNKDLRECIAFGDIRRDL